MKPMRQVLGSRVVGVTFVALVVSSAGALAVMQGAGATAVPPALHLSPQGNFHDGQMISVGVGPNGYFTPHARISFIECADPGGTGGNLPKDITTCDGNTIQGTSVIVGADGSFSLSGYPVYMLPSATLGENASGTPICNQSNDCVLYVGQDQNDFTAPKVFSAPFLVAAGQGGTSSTGATAGSSGSSGSTGSPSSGAQSSGTSGSGSQSGPVTSATSTSGALASTGPPAGVWWIATAAMVLLCTGGVGRRLALRGVR